MQVEDDDVRSGGRCDANRLRAFPDRRDDVVAGLGEITGDAGPPHRMVVDDHDPYGHAALSATRDVFGRSDRPTDPGHAHLDLRTLAGRRPDVGPPAQVAQPTADRLGDTEPAGRRGPIQRAGLEAGTVVANGDGHRLRVVFQEHPRPCAVAGVLSHVVQRAAYRGDQLLGDAAGQRHRAGRGRDRHRGRREPVQLHPDVGLSVRSGDRSRRTDERTQRGLLFAGEPAEFRRFTAERLGPARHEREHLQHRIVDVAGQPFAGAGGRRHSGRALQLFVGGRAEPRDVPDGDRGQHQKDVAVQRALIDDAAGPQVGRGDDDGGDRSTAPAGADGPGEHRPGDRDAGQRSRRRDRSDADDRHADQEAATHDHQSATSSGHRRRDGRR